MTAVENKKCGYVAFMGRPNVGKSSLTNALLGQKLSIISRKPQTTRHHILGVDTFDNTQIVFVDTPGLHQNTPKAINRSMNRSALAVLDGVDVVVFVVDGLKWNDGDLWALEKIKDSNRPVILAINKVDLLEDKNKLFAKIQEHTERFDFVQVVPVSAKSGTQVDVLRDEIVKELPEMEWIFPEDELTDRSSRFLASELIREKAMRQLGDEIPYELTVEIEKFDESEPCLKVHASILVEKPGQKGIVIGKQGSRLKKIGTHARQDMEELFQRKVMLNLWVKVKSGWSDDERALKSLGYE